MFLPWYVGTDIYPTETWIRSHPIPEGHVFEDLTVAHAGRARDYVRSGQNPLIQKFLGANWEMPPAQMYFWEVTRDEYAADKKAQ